MLPSATRAFARRRRRSRAWAAALLLAAATPAPAAGAAPPAGTRGQSAAAAPASAPGGLQLWIRRAGREEAVRLTVLSADGRFEYAALPVLRDLLRERRTGRDHPIHWRLALVLARISAAFPGAPVVVVSGYRTHSRSARRSRHLRGRAADVRVPGVPARRLVNWIRRNLPNVGVGYYPNSTFVHVDVRERGAFWVDYAGPGNPPCYDPHPAAAFASGRADRTPEATARRTICPR